MAIGPVGTKLRFAAIVVRNLRSIVGRVESVGFFLCLRVGGMALVFTRAAGAISGAHS